MAAFVVKIPAELKAVTFSRSASHAINRMSDESSVAYYLSQGYTTAEYGDYVAIRGENLSFLPSSKMAEDPSIDPWRREGRQEAKPAKFARRIITPNALKVLSDKDFEYFANRIKALAERQAGTFVLVRGDDVADWYGEHRHAPRQNLGSLTKSCMRYDWCQPFFGLYTKNPDQVGMLTLRNGQDQMIGRALVWTVPEVYEIGAHFLDRVYGADSVVETFRDYAEDQGWSYRTVNTYSDEEAITFRGVEIERRIEIPLVDVDFDSYPYVDTFKYLHVPSGVVANWKRARTTLWLMGTRGEDAQGMDRHRPRCGICRDRHRASSLEDGVCETCSWVRHFPRCERCDNYFDPTSDQWDHHYQMCSHCLPYELRPICQDCGSHYHFDRDSLGPYRVGLDRCAHCQREWERRQYRACLGCGTMERSTNLRDGYCWACSQIRQREEMDRMVDRVYGTGGSSRLYGMTASTNASTLTTNAGYSRMPPPRIDWHIPPDDGVVQGWAARAEQAMRDLQIDNDAVPVEDDVDDPQEGDDAEDDDDGEVASLIAPVIWINGEPHPTERRPGRVAIQWRRDHRTFNWVPNGPVDQEYADRQRPMNNVLF